MTGPSAESSSAPAMPRGARRWRLRDGLLRETGWFTVGVLAILFLTNSGFDTSEGLYHYRIAQQIVRHGELGITGPVEGIFTVAPNGRTYGSHEIGNTLLLIPVAALNELIDASLAGRVGASQRRYLAGFVVALVPSLYCAALAGLLYGLLRRIFDVSRRAAAWGVTSLMFCTYVWTYSRNLFDGVLCMVILTGVMVALFRYVRTRDEALLMVAVGLMGFGVITRLTMVLVIAGAAAYLTIWLRREPRALAKAALIGGLGLTPFAVWQLYYNLLRTGSPLRSPVQLEQYTANLMTGNVALGIWGLLFSPGKSLFIYCPLALLSLLCVPCFARRYPAEAAFCGVVSALWLLLHAKFLNWWGAWGWGPRLLLTIVPLVCLPFLVCGADLWRSRLGRAVTIVCAGWGLFLGITSIIGNWYFRLLLVQRRGRDFELLWSLPESQPVDMIRGMVENFRYMLAGAPPPPPMAGVSAGNQYASMTVNVWLNSAWYNGVPLPLLLVPAVFLVALAAWSFRRSWRIGSAAGVP